jgi:hypothetical protein
MNAAFDKDSSSAAKELLYFNEFKAKQKLITIAAKLLRKAKNRLLPKDRKI